MQWHTMKVPSSCKCPLMLEATTNSYSHQASLWYYPSLVILYDKPILNNIVSIVGAFRFQGSTISQDLRWTWNTASITKRHNRRYTSFVSSGSALLSSAQSHTGIIQSVLCTSSFSGLGLPPNRTRADCNGLLRTAEKIIGATCTQFRTYTPPNWGNWKGASLQTYHILDTTCSNFSRTVCGGTWQHWLHQYTMSHKCSIGFRSGEREGQSMPSMPSSSRNCLHTLAK